MPRSSMPGDRNLSNLRVHSNLKVMDMFDNLKNLSSLLGQAKDLKEKFEQLQTDLERKTVEADSGAGAVRVVANGKFEIVSVRLDRPLLGSLVGNATDLDQQVIEDLIASAVNAALAKAKEMVREEATRLTGGINIPGLDKLIG